MRTIKETDKLLNKVLWIFWGLQVAILAYFCYSITAPDYEPVKTSVQMPYTYTSKSGARCESYYVLAWKHESYKRPTIAAYDPRTGNSTSIKPEYIEEYRQIMPKTAYPFYTRWTVVIFAFLALVSALLTYIAGGALRDWILYRRINKNPDFADCAYFLYKDRIACSSRVRVLTSKNIDIYIERKSDELRKKYSPDFVNFICSLLEFVKATHNTNVTYGLTYSDKTKDQITYLTQLRSYWDGQIGVNAKAEENVVAVNNLLKLKYMPVKLLISAQDIMEAVDKQMNKLFAEILGGEVLKFRSVRLRLPSDIGIMTHNIDITVTNHPSSFTWSGVAVPAGTRIPGLEIQFKIYLLQAGIETVLWNKYLVPVCKYKAPDEEFAITELYKSMVLDTINTFEKHGHV